MLWIRIRIRNADLDLGVRKVAYTKFTNEPEFQPFKKAFMST
jgi:hypothetical protein